MWINLLYHIVLLMMLYKYELSLKLYWRRFINRRLGAHFFVIYCIKHFEGKYYKKDKNSIRYRLAITMKPAATILDPKKVIRNKQCYLKHRGTVYIKKINNINHFSPRTQVKTLHVWITVSFQWVYF